MVVRSGIIATKFDEQSFFSSNLGFNSHWDYKHFDKNISREIVNLNIRTKNHSKCDSIDGSKKNGSRQQKLFSFNSDKPAGYKASCEPETVHFF